MKYLTPIYGSKKWLVLGLLSLALVALLIVAACGESATATPEAEEAMPEPTPTAMMEEEQDESSTGLRPISEWTADNPGTHEEVVAALAAHRGGTFTFASWGGAYQAMQRQAFLVPFATEFGIEVVEDGPPDYAKVRAMARTGNITWDIIDGSGQASITMGLEGVLEELNLAIVDKTDLFPHIRDAPWIGGGGSAFSHMVMWSKDTYGDDGPKTMADVFDKDKFPGRRGIFTQDWAWKHRVRFGLLIDDPTLLDTEEGRASLSAMSPEELERAWQVVEERMIPNTDVFFAGASDCPALIQSGELDVCETDNGIAFDSVVNTDLNAHICWECGHDVLTDNWWSPKGLAELEPERWELINLFFAWSQHPEIAASQALYQPYGPTNLKSGPFLAAPEFDTHRPYLPTADANLPYAILMDEASDGMIGGAQAEIWFEVQGKN